MIPTKYNDRSGWAECVDWFIGVVRQTDMIYIVPVGTIVGLAQMVQQNSALDRNDSRWLVNIHVVFGTYWMVFYVTMPELRFSQGR